MLKDANVSIPLEQLHEIVNSKKNSDDLLSGFKTAIAALKELKNSVLKETMAAIAAVKAALTKDIDDAKKQLNDRIDVALKDQQVGMDFIREKARFFTQPKDGYSPVKGVDYFDGNPADEGALATSVFSMIQPVDMRDKLEGLSGDERLELSAIKGLREELDAIKKEMTTRIEALPRGGARSSHSTRLTDLSAQTNGSLKVFSVPEGLAGLLFSSDFPNVLMENNGFTLNKTRTQLTMTTANAPSASSQLVYQSVDIHNY